MADDNAVELIRRGDARFNNRRSLDSLRQEIALNFAPHLAEWTSPLNLGDEYCSHLADGTPLLVASEYVGMIGSMLRPSGKQWFWHRTPFEDLNTDPELRDYMDWRSLTMNRIMFDRVTGAERALTAADEFYGLIGDAVISVDWNETLDSLRILNHHTKDTAWDIGSENKPDTLTRKEYPAARVIKRRFSRPGDKIDNKIEEACEQDGSKEFEIRHEVLPAEEYDAYVKRKGKADRKGWVSVWVDVTHKRVMRETYTPTFRYVIPRAGARSRFPYGFSRATMIALPDSRMIQQMAVAVIEAAEKQLSPPLIATKDAIRGTIALDGITWVDGKYDERMGDPLRALELGKNFKLGLEQQMRIEAQIARAFKLDRLRYPDTRASKTKEEAAFLIDEFVRAAVPMFSPMKAEYSDELLYEVDALIELAGGYKARPKPETLRGPNMMMFQWDNPLTDMIERQKAARLSEIGMLVQTAVGIEVSAQQAPSVGQIDVSKALRETVISVQAASWLKSEKQAKRDADAAAEANAEREALANAPNVAQVIKSGAEAAQIASGIPNPAEPAYPMLPAPV